MKTKLFPIAKITRASGLNGEVGVRPLIRQFDDYVEKPLFIGFDEMAKYLLSIFFAPFGRDFFIKIPVFYQTYHENT